MKKFNFSLQKILEIKEQLLKNLKIELTNLNLECRNIEDHIKNLKVKFKSIDNEYVEKTYKSISTGEMLYYKMLMESILKQIEVKEEEREILLKKMSVKRQEIISMNIEISSLEKLKEKEMEKYNKEFMRKEEIFIDEFVSNKSMSNKYAI
jgi:flagellar FliJ protein